MSCQSDYKIKIESPETNILEETKEGLQYNYKVTLATTISVTKNNLYNRIIEKTAKDKKI